MTFTKELKDALKGALENLPATSDGTEIQQVVGSGEDAFDKYPTIRVVPAGMNRTVNSEDRYIDRTVNFVISTYLDLGEATTPDEDVIDALIEITDNILDRLDTTDWLPAGNKGDKYHIEEDAITGVIDTTPSKTGTAVYCDLLFPITYRTVL